MMPPINHYTPTVAVRLRTYINLNVRQRTRIVLSCPKRALTQTSEHGIQKR